MKIRQAHKFLNNWRKIYTQGRMIAALRRIEKWFNARNRGIRAG